MEIQFALTNLKVYLSKQLKAKNKIVFFYHDPVDPKASVVKSFSDSEEVEKYWALTQELVIPSTSVGD